MNAAVARALRNALANAHDDEYRAERGAENCRRLTLPAPVIAEAEAVHLRYKQQREDLERGIAELGGLPS